ncbi:TCP11 isoform 7 [Pan troglodytes]|uniref:TCP11 isoform 7 n=1 Tax=Pan troglodytes TaxID=9598 RepID=A0A2J8NYX2_PANTR|nr:TCP11 isoform 7 [Pan troglodytes]
MTRGGGGGGEEEIPSAKCQTSRRVCPRNILATQRAGPVSPKPQDSPRKTRAAPRTPLPVFSALRGRSSLTGTHAVFLLISRERN